MGDLKDLAAKLEAWAIKVEAGGPKLKAAAATAILQTVVTATPVGNPTIWREPKKARKGYIGGRARANWFVGLGSATTETTEATDESGADTINRGTAAIGGVRQGEPIHINNNLPYITELNDGHSHQAPAGFIEHAVAEGIAALQNVKILD